MPHDGFASIPSAEFLAVPGESAEVIVNRLAGDPHPSEIHDWLKIHRAEVTEKLVRNIGSITLDHTGEDIDWLRRIQNHEVVSNEHSIPLDNEHELLFPGLTRIALKAALLSTPETDSHAVQTDAVADLLTRQKYFELLVLTHPDAVTERQIAPYQAKLGNMAVRVAAWDMELSRAHAEHLAGELDVNRWYLTQLSRIAMNMGDDTDTVSNWWHCELDRQFQNRSMIRPARSITVPTLPTTELVPVVA